MQENNLLPKKFAGNNSEEIINTYNDMAGYALQLLPITATLTLYKRNKHLKIWKSRILQFLCVMLIDYTMQKYLNFTITKIKPAI